MLSTSTQTAKTEQTVNPNDRRKFPNGKICSIDRRWSQAEVYLITQNLRASSILFQNFHTFTDRNDFLRQWNTKTSHLFDRQQINKTMFLNQNHSTTIMEGVWLRPALQIDYSTRF